jgi:hypothetical protein
MMHVMAQREHEPTFASTTWEWKRVKIDPPLAAPPKQSPKAAARLARRAAREPTTLTIRYRGGAEAWWEVKARGRSWRVPGHVALHDVMRMVLNLDVL